MVIAFEFRVLSIGSLSGASGNCFCISSLNKGRWILRVNVKITSLVVSRDTVIWRFACQHHTAVVACGAFIDQSPYCFSKLSIFDEVRYG